MFPADPLNLIVNGNLFITKSNASRTIFCWGHHRGRQAAKIDTTVSASVRGPARRDATMLWVSTSSLLTTAAALSIGVPLLAKVALVSHRGPPGPTFVERFGAGAVQQLGWAQWR